MIASLTIQGEPTPKGRPRFSCIKGKPHVYTPAKTLAAEEELGWHLRSAMTGPPTDQDVHLSVSFYAKSKRADLDNFVKLLMDSANGIVWHDDRQVTRITAQLVRVKTNPRTELSVAISDAMEEAA